MWLSSVRKRVMGTSDHDAEDVIVGPSSVPKSLLTCDDDAEVVIW